MAPITEGFGSLPRAFLVRKILRSYSVRLVIGSFIKALLFVTIIYNLVEWDN